MTTQRFDQLDVYRTAIQYVGVTRPLVLRLRREDAIMAGQLHRAVLSIPLNVAEGAGEFSPGDKAKLYRYALRSAAETIAVLDSAREIELMPEAEHVRCKDHALRIMAMLTRLVMSVATRDRKRKTSSVKPDNGNG